MDAAAAKDGLVDSDWDFNDVVFDAKWKDNTTATIKVKVVGGVLPLYIGNAANPRLKEVHELFGVETGTMVNTNNGTVSRPIVQFTIPGVVSPRQVTVRVAENAKEVVLKAEEGQAPQKICVNTTYQWCNEREQIGDKYANFPDYVKNKQVAWY